VTSKGQIFIGPNRSDTTLARTDAIYVHGRLITTTVMLILLLASADPPQLDRRCSLFGIAFQLAGRH
jgi:hypothetical protein